MGSFPAYVLAGGRSSRFGSDKARATLAGLPLIQRIAQFALARLPEVTVVADVEGKYADLGLRTIADRTPGAGPLAGLETALHDAAERGHTWLFLTSCDLLDLKPHWIDQLTAAAQDPAEFVAFRHTHWEPLLACYRTSLLPRVRDHLASNRRALKTLLDASTGTALPLPSDWPKTLQANTPAELQAAQDG